MEGSADPPSGPLTSWQALPINTPGDSSSGSNINKEGEGRVSLCTHDPCPRPKEDAYEPQPGALQPSYGRTSQLHPLCLENGGSSWGNPLSTPSHPTAQHGQRQSSNPLSFLLTWTAQTTGSLQTGAPAPPPPPPPSLPTQATSPEAALQLTDSQEWVPKPGPCTSGGPDLGIGCLHVCRHMCLGPAVLDAAGTDRQAQRSSALTSDE